MCLNHQLRLQYVEFESRKCPSIGVFCRPVQVVGQRRAEANWILPSEQQTLAGNLIGSREANGHTNSSFRLSSHWEKRYLQLQLEGNQSGNPTRRRVSSEYAARLPRLEYESWHPNVGVRMAYLSLLIASLVSDIKLPASEYRIHVRLEVLRPVDRLNNYLLWESYHRQVTDSGAVQFKKRWQRYIKCYRPCLTAKRLLIYPSIDGRSAILTYKTKVNKTGDMQFIHQLSSYPPNSRYEPQTPFQTNHTDCFIDGGIHNCAHDKTQTGQLDFIEGNKEADARLRVRYNDPTDLEYFGFDQCALTKQYKKNDVYQVVPLYQTILMPSDRPTPNFCFQMYGTLQTQFYTLEQVRAMINSSAFKQADPLMDPSKFNFTVGVQFIATRANASLGFRVFQLSDQMKRVFMPKVLRQFVYVVVGLFLVVLVLDVVLFLMLIVIRSIGHRQKPANAASVVYRYIPVLFNPRTDGHPVNFQPDDTEAPHTSELPPTCPDDASAMKTVQLTATKTKLVGVKEPSASASTTRRRFGQKVSSNERISGHETSQGKNEVAKSSAEPLHEPKPTNLSAEPTADRSLSLQSKPPVEYSAKE
ncbi:hypothetical protein M3Y98_00736600 [Aphelenchoides besseyi]|nr:hypothetical protein M3Y98_00736600 [Aphelenchoides besseyi]